MTLPSVEIILLLIAAGFVAAFIDSVVGGGGLVMIPVLLLTGLPPALALGTNKFGGTLSSLTSSTAFFLSGKIDRRLVLLLFPLSFGGAACGTYMVQLIPSSFLRPLVVVMLVVILIYTLIKKNWQGSGRPVARFSMQKVSLIGAAAFVIGFYDGFFGPGTGSFLLFLFLLLGFDFVVASGNAKVLNLASNLASLFVFVWFHSVQYGYGLFLGPAMIAGALTGSMFAIRRGTSLVKPLFVVVTLVLIGKQLWDLLAQ